MTTPTYTPTESRLVAMLSDGKVHSRRELLTCIDDDQAEFANLRVHLSRVRKKVQPLGQDIMYVSGNCTSGYRHVCLLF